MHVLRLVDASTLIGYGADGYPVMHGAGCGYDQGIILAQASVGVSNGWLTALQFASAPS
jgi:hypothetical protein